MISNYYHRLRAIPPGNLLAELIAQPLPTLAREKTYRMLTPAYSKVENENHIIFIHIPKTAGNAIMSSLFDLPATGHDPINKYYRRSHRKFETYFKFAIVRNPWDRLLSSYMYLKQGGLRRIDRRFAREYLREYDSFQDFVMALRMPVKRRLLLQWTHFRPQCEYICTEPGHIALDYVGRFEHLEEAFDHLKTTLDITRDVHLRSINKSEHEPYWNYYSDDTIEIVREAYADDVSLLGYDFV